MKEINELRGTAELYLQKAVKAQREGRQQHEKFYLQHAAELIVTTIPRHRHFDRARADRSWQKWHTDSHQYIKDTGLSRLENLSVALQLPTPPHTPLSQHTLDHPQSSSASMTAQSSQLDTQSAPSEASSATVVPEACPAQYRIPPQQPQLSPVAPSARQPLGSCSPSGVSMAQQGLHCGRMFRPASPDEAAARAQQPSTPASCPRGVFRGFPPWLQDVNASNCAQKDVKCSKHRIIGQSHDTDMQKLRAEVDTEGAAETSGQQDGGAAAPQQHSGRQSWKSKVSRLIPKRNK